MKKYELLTDETLEVGGKTLFRIRALKTFKLSNGIEIVKGTEGGFIEKEHNLSHYGNAWVDGDARVSGDAWVYGNAWVSGDAQVTGDAWVTGNDIFTISNIGSRNNTTTFFKTADNKIAVVCGCFYGDIDTFEKKVKETHGDNKHSRAYSNAIELAKIMIELDNSNAEVSNDK